MEAFRLNKYEIAPEWIDPYPRLREDIVTLKSLMAPDKPVLTRCRSSYSMNEFYLLVDASG